MSFSRIQSAQLSGIDATGVTIETDINRGLYLFQIVGLPDKAVEESRERVISALRNSFGKNIKAENQKVVVSLSPAELKKEGAYFDVAIALGYLLSSEEIFFDTNKKIFVGELSLNGDIRPIKGLLSIAKWAKENEIYDLFIPAENTQEAQLLNGINFYPAKNIIELVNHLKKIQEIKPVIYKKIVSTKNNPEIDFGSVRGQAQAKRALLIAASGGHNIVLYGPPGTGKSMLARAFHGILPNLTNEEFLEVATIYSSVGQAERVLHTLPPIRSPHHSSSHVSILGGGQNIRPGDITLSHNGVLYLDEFPEFDRRVIEGLREPLEEGHITVARAKGSVKYPAKFILLASMNPCKCGYRGSGIKLCTCTGVDIARYNKKISGPIIDRIDIWVPVENVEYETLHQNHNEFESLKIKNKVLEIRNTQLNRFKKLNSKLSSDEIQSKINIDKDALKILQESAKKLHLSPRSYLKIIKVAQTISDIDNEESIKINHILEALQYRPKFE